MGLYRFGVFSLILAFLCVLVIFIFMQNSIAWWLYKHIDGIKDEVILVAAPSFGSESLVLFIVCSPRSSSPLLFDFWLLEISLASLGSQQSTQSHVCCNLCRT